VVVKVGGTADVAKGRVGQDIRHLLSGGARVVVAHGGGDALTAWHEAQRRPTNWVDGLRVTDAQTRDDAVMIYRGVVAPAVVGELVSAGISAVGLGGVDGAAVRVRQRAPELGYVGDVHSVNTTLLDDLTSRGHVPVLSPLGLGPDGELYNVNGDDVAAGVGRAVHASALVFLTDVEGVGDAEGRVIPELSAQVASRLVNAGVISGGMVTKVRAAVGLLDAVDSVWIADGLHPHVLRRALIERRTGTRIVP
jgi:acetylglutamate kinase